MISENKLILTHNMNLLNIINYNESKSAAMETSLKNSGKRGIERFQRICSLLFLFICSTSVQLMAQADVKNLKNSFKTIKEEQEKIAHDQFMSYVYMALGFAIVMGIAWSTTVMARNRNKKEMEKKQAYLLRQQEMRKQGHVYHRPRR